MEALILHAFTGSGDHNVDESEVEVLNYGHTEWGMVSYSWTDMWYLEILGDEAFNSGVLIHGGIQRGSGKDVCHLGASAVK